MQVKVRLDSIKTVVFMDNGRVQAIYIYPCKLLVVTFLTLLLVYQLSGGEVTET